MLNVYERIITIPPMLSHLSNWIKNVVFPRLFLCGWLMSAQQDKVLLPMQIYLPSLSQAFVLGPFPHSCTDVWSWYDCVFSYWILWLLQDFNELLVFVFPQLTAYDLEPFGDLSMEKNDLGDESYLFRNKSTWNALSRGRSCCPALQLHPSAA